MLFLSLVFVLFQAYGLIKGKMFYELQLQSAEYEVKLKRGDITEVPKELTVRVIMLGLYILTLFILQVVLVVNALTFDPFLFPTIGFIVLMFLNFIVNAGNIKKKDLDTEVGRMKFLSKASRKRTFKGFTLSLIYLAYFVYIFLVILKVIQ